MDFPRSAAVTVYGSASLNSTWRPSTRRAVSVNLRPGVTLSFGRRKVKGIGTDQPVRTTCSATISPGARFDRSSNCTCSSTPRGGAIFSA